METIHNLACSPLEKKKEVVSASEMQEWSSEAQRDRCLTREYLTHTPPFSDLWIKRELLSKALKPIAAKKRGDPVDILESKGSNMEVQDFSLDDFEVLLRQWVRDNGGDPEFCSEQITAFASLIFRRLVFKIGNVDQHIVKFGGKTSVFPRDDMEKSFAPLGYPVKNTKRRACKCAAEAVAINQYIGNEEECSITGVSLPALIRKFLEDPVHFEMPKEGTDFFIEDESKENCGRGVAEFAGLSRADYPQYVLDNKKLRAYNAKEMEGDLRPFFDALVTIGWHDFLRRITGYNKHTSLTYEQAENLMSDLCEKHQKSSFVVQEQTTYGYDPHLSAQEYEEILIDNTEVARNLSYMFRAFLPRSVRGLFEDEEVAFEFCYRILEHYHEVPEYEVDSATGILNLRILKFLTEAIHRLFIAKTSEVDRREDFDADPLLSKILSKFSHEQRDALFEGIKRMLEVYEETKGRKGCKVFRRIEKTQVKTQDRLDYCGEDCEEILDGPFSLAKIMNEKPELFQKYPEIAEQLVVYFYQVYRFYKDTGYVPDMRPDNIVKYVFGMGEWAMRTENIQVVVYKKQGEDTPVVRVINIDPEDHFRAIPKKNQWRNPFEGVATYGLGMIDGISVPAIRKALARYLDEVANNRKIRGAKEQQGLLGRVVGFGSALIRRSLEVAEGNVETVTNGVDDMAHEVEVVVNEVVGGNLLT